MLGAQLPDTDIWLFELRKNKSHKTEAVNGKNISARKGYDNQPSFDSQSKNLYYSAMMAGQQTDIYKYTLKKKKTTRVTITGESEYSPVPLQDNNSFSCVVVEKDSTQRVYIVNSETGAATYKSTFDSVGYYTFLNADTIVYYQLTSPPSLRYHVKSSGEDKFIASSPIRTFLTLNRHVLLFGIKEKEQLTFFKYDFLLAKAIKYTSLSSLSEDFFYHPDYGLMMSEGNKLLRFIEKTGTWQQLFDLSASGISKITRFAISPDGKFLAVVDNP
jgi:hypothetical protein